MKKLQAFFSFFLVLFLSQEIALAARCHDKSLQGSLCYVSAQQIHPTQFVLGMLAITPKMKKVESLEKKGKIENYLKKKFAPAILGPDGLFYITDKHHTSYAIFNSRLHKKYKKLYLKIIHNWSSLSEKEFSYKMTTSHYFWPRDEHQQLRDFSELPKHINNLKDDPYRSLAWLVREKGGFKKTGINFQEFYWAMFFKKQGIKLTSSQTSEVNAVMPVALQLATSPLASHLPGYQGQKD